MTTIVIKKLAANVLRKHGWCQNQFISSKGERCLTGALHVIMSGLATTRSECDVVYEDLQARCDGNIAAWNDVSGRTIEEVLELLEAP